MSRRKHRLETKTWEQVVNPVFEKAKELFNWKVEKQARKYADILRKGNIKGKNRKHIAVASIYASVKDSEYSASMERIAMEFGVATVSIRTYFKYLVKLVEGEDGR